MKMLFINRTDESTFELIKNGNEEAFTSLFQKYYAPLCRYAFTYLKDKDESENIIQELFINIWNNRLNINITSSVSSYLYRSAKNNAINFINKKSRNPTESLDNIQELEIANEDPEIDENEFTDMERKFSEALEALPDKCRMIFKMSRVEGLKYKEISAQLDISIKTVEAQMSIALKKLKSHYMT